VRHGRQAVPHEPWAPAQKAVRLYAAFEERVEIVFDELRQIGAGGVSSLGDEGRGLLLHQAVQRGLSRAVALVALVMHRSASRRPLGLPADGLHARLPRL